MGTQLDNLPSTQGHCGVCHYKFRTGANPWNPFGEAIKHTPYSISDVNDTASISNAILYVVNSATDWDGDSFANSFEITNRTYANTPTFPGLSSNNVSSVSQVTAMHFKYLKDKSRKSFVIFWSHVTLIAECNPWVPDFLSRQMDT